MADTRPTNLYHRENRSKCFLVRCCSRKHDTWDRVTLFRSFQSVSCFPPSFPCSSYYSLTSLMLLARGDKKKAQMRLRGGARARSHHWSTFCSGLMLGLAVPALVHGIYLSQLIISLNYFLSCISHCTLTMSPQASSQIREQQYQDGMACSISIRSSWCQFCLSYSLGWIWEFGLRRESTMSLSSVSPLIPRTSFIVLITGFQSWI